MNVTTPGVGGSMTRPYRSSAMNGTCAFSTSGTSRPARNTLTGTGCELSGNPRVREAYVGL
jgi:hypothetical protein